MWYLSDSGGNSESFLIQFLKIESKEKWNIVLDFKMFKFEGNVTMMELIKYEIMREYDVKYWITYLCEQMHLFYQCVKQQT